jgi:uncharacterized protein
MSEPGCAALPRTGVTPASVIEQVGHLIMNRKTGKSTAWLSFVGFGVVTVVGSFQNVRSIVKGAAESESRAETHNHTNRLIQEKSPYLLQHAHNPVDWYPWGEAAFAKARQENKPIFLSVGYSTCHWCHVMERESFENTEMARILNEHFVSIKVDREERPDVDSVYMTFVQATTGGGGWPLNVWLTPDLKPFVGGTYFPPEAREGLPGFRSMLLQIVERWKKDNKEVLGQAEQVMKALRGYAARASNSGEREMGRVSLTQGFESIAARFDKTQGGFGHAPKFPRPAGLSFLFHTYAREGRTSKDGQNALKMSLFTLRKMAEGGIHDHLGGGFHRYSVDAYWHVPHFEKMLYDQAQLAVSYVEAYQITQESFFAGVAREILEYVRRDMTDKQGGFYSAEDADSLLAAGKPEHAEGAFYVWTSDQIRQALGEERAKLFNAYYGVEANGNAPKGSDPHGEFVGKNILIQRQSIAAMAKAFQVTEDEARKSLGESRMKLFALGAKRPRPHLDDKILTAWNGLMISAFARASQILDEPAYLQAATTAATFLQSRLYDPKSRTLKRSYRQGTGETNGFLSDYAFLVQGLIDLYEASFETRWLAWAMELQKTQDDLFWDPMQGAYFDTTGKDSTILLRMKEDYDGAEPAPNSVAALNLQRLAQMLDSKDWQAKARQTLGAFAGRLKSAPSDMPQMLVALDFHLDKAKQIVIAGNLQHEDVKAMLREVHRQYIPNKVILLADGGEGQRFLSQYLGFLQSVKMHGGKATSFICENYVCQLPTTDLKVMVSLLQRTDGAAGTK